MGKKNGKKRKTNHTKNTEVDKTKQYKVNNKKTKKKNIY